jgi:hypothetical protein
VQFAQALRDLAAVASAVAALYEPWCVVEIDAVAVVD